ncbi:MAG: right-handed parallel beta-helix repeat-containing protein [Verrucomicrobia bacterium]|nr:right-handed parallel beta-helix repeat-containing protein [Verrucomicrobiota bacterium]MCH8529037.1 right-handed parallel beta-helix repeat-containing protein [Kiritimatiellia bacterium]
MEYHIALNGSDANPGTAEEPLRTIQAGADLAQPGDTVTVHEGLYRERVNPPRGGTADDRRITYQAAPGETVVIKGSEILTGWTKVRNDTWEANVPNRFFGGHNPFEITVHGDWFTPIPRGVPDLVYHIGEVYLNGHWLKEAQNRETVLEPAGEHPLWFAEVDSEHTTIHAQFTGVDPNRETVEINVREAVFYPVKPGVNHITVRGFTMEHAANNWAPPTAEQVGLIGTHWSKGWVIEDNTIRYAKCSGVSLGKYGDTWDNDGSQSAEGYVGTIKRALENGWSKANIGSHIVRNNCISHCEQTGIVGSMGAAFSTVTGNDIHDINLRGMLAGEEMAGIKFHGAVDTVIRHNHVYRCGGFGGIWLDWMAQGTRVTGNLLHDNHRQDLFVEVNHGPFLVDNNLFLSDLNLLEASGGGAYAHNLFLGRIKLRPEKNRETPYLRPHSTEILGLSKVVGDDERYYNNLFAGPDGLSVYNEWEPGHLEAAGNVYLGGSSPGNQDRNELVDETFDPVVKLRREDDGWWLEMAVDPAWGLKAKRERITTQTLGKATIPDAPFEDPDGTPYRLDTDTLGETRSADNPAPGPFCLTEHKQICLKVWPKEPLAL